MTITAGIAVCQTPADAITQHFNALKKHDVDAIVAGYASDAKMYSPNWEGVKMGSADIRIVYTRYFSSTPDLTYEIKNIINADSEIVAQYTASGTLSNPEGETPAYMKGKKYSLNYCAIFILQNNKIVQETDYFDQVAFLKQVGFFDQR